MDKATAPLDWARLYYDSVEHLLWNPDWIRSHQPDGTRRTVRTLMHRLERLEAPLHHAVQLFLTLAPHDLVTRILGIDVADSAHHEIICCRNYMSWRLDPEKKASLLDLCQPDIFVDCGHVQVAIEIKSRGKSSLEQLFKYAALLALRRQKPSASKLLFLAPYGTFAEFWTGKAYPRVDDLRNAARKHDAPDLDRKLRRFGSSLDEVKATLDSLEIDWRSLGDVLREVNGEMEWLQHQLPSAAGEVYRKLLTGFERELQQWPRSTS